MGIFTLQKTENKTYGSRVLKKPSAFIGQICNTKKIKYWSL
jgi:hypothetical protein